MNHKSCFFIGHRETTKEILPALEHAIEQHISEYGVREFVVGGYGGFDRLASAAVVRAKQQHGSLTRMRGQKTLEIPRFFCQTLECLETLLTTYNSL